MKTQKLYVAALTAAAFALSGCGGASGTAPSTAALPQSPGSDQMASVIDTTVLDGTLTSPAKIHIGFEHGEHTDPVFGPVYYYSKLLAGSAQVIKVRHGAKVVFVNDDPSGAPHTASGLGAVAFPASFDNTSKFTKHGTTINGSLTWSTGALVHGATSQVFTVGPVGHYFFGCGFHYTTVPTATNGSMGDVLVSM